MGTDFKLSGILELVGVDSSRALNQLRQQLSQLPNVDLSKGTARIAKDADAGTAGIKRLNRELSVTANGMQDFSDKAGIALRRFSAFTLAAGAVFGGARLVLGGLQQAAQFERELIKVQQVTNASASSINDLRKEIGRLGVDLAAPASDLAGVARTLSQAGYSVSQVKTLLESLARTRLSSTFGTIQDTTEGVIAIMGQFKLRAEEVQDALALTNAVAAKYAVEAEDLISAVQRTGGAFAAASSGIDEGHDALAKFYALFTSVRQVTRQAPETIATGIRSVISRIQRPGTENFLEGFGIQTRDAKGQFLGVYEALQNIAQALEHINPLSREYSSIIEKVGGARQYGIVVPLLREWRLQQEILNKSLAEQGNFLKQSEVPLGTLVEKFNILSNTWANFSRDVLNSPTFQVMANGALQLSTNLVRVLDTLHDFIPLIAVIGAASIGKSLFQSDAFSFFFKRAATGAAHVPGKAGGGPIPGSGFGDKVHIMAEPGEFMIRKAAAQALGGSVLNKLNHAEKFAKGGFIGGYEKGGTIDFGSDQEFNELRKQFRNLAKSVGFSDKEFNNLANEIRISALSVEEGRKLFKGGLQARQYSNDNLRSGVFAYGTPSKIATSSVRTSAPSLFHEGSSPQLLLTDQRVPFPVPLDQRKDQALGKIRLAKLADTYAKTDHRDRRALDYINEDPSGRQGNLFNTGGIPRSKFGPNVVDIYKPSDNDLEVSTYGKLSRTGYRKGFGRKFFKEDVESQNSYINETETSYLNDGTISGGLGSNPYGGLFPPGGQPPYKGPPNLRQKFNRFITKDVNRTFTGSRLGGITRGIGNGLSNADPLTLGILATTAQSILPDTPASSAVSGALGGAALGSFAGNFLPPQYKGAAVATGAVIGGIQSVIGKQSDIEQTKYAKELTENTKQLNEAFKDLSSNGISKLTNILDERVNITDKQFTSESKSFKDKALENVGGIASTVGTVGGSYLLKRAGLGALGTAASAFGAAAYGTIEAGHAIYNATGEGYNRDSGGLSGKVFNSLYDEKSHSRETQIAARQPLAEKNIETAKNARDLISQLLVKGRGNEITDKLRLTAISDRADLNLTTSKSGRLDNYRQEVGIKLQEEANKKIKGEDVTQGFFKEIDNFQSRMQRVVDTLGVFDLALANSGNEIQNTSDIGNGTFKQNLSLNNPFSVIEGLTSKQIQGSIGGLEKFTGTKFDNTIKQTAGAIPTLNNFGDLINGEYRAAQKSGVGFGKEGDATSFVSDALSKRGGKLSGLPDFAKHAINKLFEGLSPGDAQEALENPGKVQDNISKIGEPVKKALEAAQKGKNDLINQSQGGYNQVSQFQVQQGVLGQNYQSAITQGAVLRNELRGNRYSSSIEVSGEKAGITALTGGTADPNRIKNNIDSLVNQKRAIEGQLNNGNNTDRETLALQGNLAGVNSSLTKNKQGLDQLAQSAIGLAAIQKELADLEKRRQGAITNSVGDALGINREQRVKEQRALATFERTGSFASVKNQGFSQSTLAAGFERRRQEIETFGTTAEKEQFENSVTKKFLKEGVRYGNISQAQSDRNNAVINDPQINKLKAQADVAGQTQLEAINAQRTLLATATSELDATIQNKFLVGVDNLREVVKNMATIPETIQFNIAPITHNININGPHLEGLDKYVTQITSRIVNSAITQMTEGRNGKTDLPGLDQAFGGQ